ncbi:MAG TPA: formate dehydrogenase subunit delta [Stellaceae bacterium]|nr:formate dehydrogenase subunit delta [Stellaceae bacterium]
MATSHANMDKLVRMANQIAAYFQSYPHDEAVEGVSEHLRKFWEPRMLNAMKAHVAEGGKDLHILVPEAVRRLA